MDPFIKQVLAPVGAEDFFNHYWERQPLHVERDDETHFAELISVDDIEQILSTQDLRYPECQLTESGQHIDPGDYTDSGGRIIPLRVTQRHRGGATLVVSRAHRRSAGLANLVRDAIMTLQWRCQANVYLSPPGRQGFNPHYDTHDVFILQAAGSKRFRFYRGGVEFPLVNDAFDASIPIDPSVVEEVVLTAGDTLFIPRGLAHDAVAEADHTSLHVTLGVFPVTEVELARQCLQIASEKRVDLRRSLPRAVWLNSAVQTESDANSGRSLLSTLNLAPFRQEALSRLRDEVFVGADRSGDAFLTDIGNSDSLSTLDDDTLLETLQSGLIAERLDNRLKLRTLGQVLEFEGAMAMAVEAFLACGSIRVGELKGLDEQQRLLLSKRLLHERIAQIANR